MVSIYVQAQNNDITEYRNSFPEEHVAILANSQILLSGQTLQFKITCSTKNNQKAISDMAYVELVSNDKKGVFLYKIHLENSVASGDFFLPSTLKTGHYKLIAYTNLTLNNDEGAFDEEDIYIINPYLNAVENDLKHSFSETERYIEISKVDNLHIVDQNESHGLKILTDFKSYPKRAKVQLKIQNNLNNSNFGNYSISVKKIDSIEVQKHYIENEQNIEIRPIKALPEMRGELIQGAVVDSRTNKPAANQSVSISIGGDDYVYKSTRTNLDGHFYFNLFETHEQENAIIQVVTESREDYALEIFHDDFPYYDYLSFYPVKLDENLKNYIESNSIYNQVESAYYSLKMDSINETLPAKSFYGEPDVVYFLDDFKRFPTVRETFIEVIEDAAIRSTNEGFKFLVYDIDIHFQGILDNHEPLLIMDGIQIQDKNIVVEYNPNLIESVSLVKGIYSVGSNIYNGIIDIKLKKPRDFKLTGSFLKEIDIIKPIASKSYFNPEYENNVDKQNRTPDFRTQLLWLPSLDLNSSLHTIEFYTSDITGYYQVELNGIAADGKAVHLTSIFEVTK